MRADRGTREFVAFGTAMTELAAQGWPCTPGAALFDTSGSAALLHFAPGRWLVPQPAGVPAAMVAVATEHGYGTAVEVDGKWVAMNLAGREASRALASAIDIEASLMDRDCAAVTVFDCPAVVVATADGYRLWVGASHAGDFAAAIARLNGSGPC